MQNLGGSVRWVVSILPPEQRREFRRSLAQSAVQPQRSPKDDMFGNFPRRAQTRQKPSLHLFLGERRDCVFEGLLVVLPTFEGTCLRYRCPCYFRYSLYFCDSMPGVTTAVKSERPRIAPSL